MLLVVDTGLGNVGSMSNMLGRLGFPCVVSGEPRDVERASKIILPGVGAFDKGMRALRARNLVGVLNEKVLGQNTPVLGVCLGLHLFGESSEEGTENGLGWLPLKARKFPAVWDRDALQVPHMGWNTVRPAGSSGLFSQLPQNPRFYFVHSYYVASSDGNLVAGTTEHGFEFCSAAVRGRIAGVQFHPEKSHRYGMGLLRNFVESF